MLSTKTMSAAFGLGLAILVPLSAWGTTITPGGVAIVAADDYDYQGTFATDSGANTLTFDLTALNELMLDGGVSTLEFTGKFTGLSVMLDGVAAHLDSFATLARAYSFDQVAFAAGDMKSLVLSWDEVIRGNTTRNGVAQINLQLSTAAATVPVPAGGFLLFGALAGLAALRRRKLV